MDGVTFTPDMVVGAPRKGLKVTLYNRYKTSACNIRGGKRGGPFYMRKGCMANLDKDAKAREHKHMTFKEAAKIAKEAQPKEMWLTHFSPSLVRPLEYMDTVTDIFENAKAGKDGMSVNLCFED